MSLSFSISVPVGAYHPLLWECLASLAVQTPRPHVSLLDASSDIRVKEIADAFGELITYRRHGSDDGQSAAIIEGWTQTPGEILGWLNADDALYPGALAVAAQRFEQASRPAVVYGHSVIINDDFDVTGYHWAVEPPSENLLAGDIISQPSCFFTRDAYDRVGGLDSHLHYTMDWDLWVRFWRLGARFDFIDSVMSRVLWTGEAKTGGFGSARRKELDRIINQNTSLRRQLKSKTGFALHHLFEYIMPPTLARNMRRQLAPKSSTINGLGRNGDIIAKALLPIVHYRKTLVTTVTANFSRPGKVNLKTDNAAVDTDSASAQITLSPPLPAGETLTLTIENKGKSPALLSSVRLD